MTSNKIVLEDLEAIRNSTIDWQRFAGKTVLITGANGFLPAYMVETLLYVAERSGMDIRVVGLVRNLAKAKKRFAEYAGNANLSFIEQDVSTPVELPGKIDFIVHAASQASPKYYGTDPVGTLSANVFGTLNLMNLAREKKIESFLYFSSGEVYGQIDNEHNPVKENYYGYLDPMQVRACYGESKRMGENICVSYHKQYGINAKVVRPFHTYGPGMALDDGRVYADFVADILARRNIEMKSDGSARRAFCYLKDATIGFFTVLLNGTPGEAYNVGNPNEEHSILDLAKTVVQLSDAGLQVVKVATNDDTQYLKSPLLRNTPNVDKLLTLGWHPQTTIAVGFKRTIDSYLV
jgi:UDP-glucuronate decarboxylase